MLQTCGMAAQSRATVRLMGWLGALALGLSAVLAGFRFAGWPGGIGTVLLLSILFWGALALSRRTKRIFQQKSGDGPPVFSAQVGAGMGQLSLADDALRYHRSRKRQLTLELPWADIDHVIMNRKGPLGSVAMVEVTVLSGRSHLLEVADGPRLAKELDDRAVALTVTGW